MYLYKLTSPYTTSTFYFFRIDSPILKYKFLTLSLTSLSPNIVLFYRVVVRVQWSIVLITSLITLKSRVNSKRETLSHVKVNVVLVLR